MEHLQSVVFGQPFMDYSGFIYPRFQIQLVAQTGGEVISAMRRRSVDNARPLVHGDVICENAQNFALLPWQKWMVEPGMLHHFSGKMGE